MKVEFIPSEDARLSYFLSKNDHLIIHTPTYAKFISSAFSCTYLFACYLENDLIKTVLPFVEVKSTIFGKRIISTAYLEYGGFAGSIAGVKPILEKLQENYKDSFDYLEIRGGCDTFDTDLTLITTKKNFYKRFVLDLGNFPRSGESSTNSVNNTLTQSMFSTFTLSSGTVPAIEFFRRNIQESKLKAIKKAKRNNVEVKELSFSKKDPTMLDDFYNLYCRNMKRFGSPAYAMDYFLFFNDDLIENKLGKVYGAYINGELAAALVGLCYKDRVHIIIAVSDDQKQEYRPNDAVHCEFIEWAIENNFTYFDFGRVREESGQFEYKQKWGPTLLDLPSYFVMWNGKDVPVVDPHQTKYKLFVAAWRRMPLWLTKKVGHRLRKELGI